MGFNSGFKGLILNSICNYACRIILQPSFLFYPLLQTLLLVKSPCASLNDVLWAVNLFVPLSTISFPV